MKFSPCYFYQHIYCFLNLYWTFNFGVSFMLQRKK